MADVTYPGVVWPKGLRLLAFGWHFNQTVKGTGWPDGLREVSFGCAFNSPIDEVCLLLLL